MKLKMSRKPRLLRNLNETLNIMARDLHIDTIIQKPHVRSLQSKQLIRLMIPDNVGAWRAQIHNVKIRKMKGTIFFALRLPNSWKDTYQGALWKK